jgi:predicted AAA+ superfamily ATPase
MDKLYEKSFKKIDSLSHTYQRDFIKNISTKDRLIGLKGSRGVGKTTMLLQYIKYNLPVSKETIYVSLDDLYFSRNTLIDFTDSFVKNGGKYLILDEVHRYANWSQEIKNIYDDHSELQIIYTGSSILHLHKAKADLSRRSVMHELPGLSLREFIELNTGEKFSCFSLEGILENHVDIARSIVKKIKPIAEFNRYLEYGYYPYFLENKDSYLMKVAETVNLILEMDLPLYQQLNYSSVDKLKQLLAIIAESVPFKPNVIKLADKIGTTRNTIKDNFNYLHSARVVNLLFSATKGISALQKPDKVYLNNTNIAHALKSRELDKGNLRETFFMNQLAIKHNVTYTDKGDFKIDDQFVFEVGGKNKTREQVKEVKNSYLALDDIEIGMNDKIPLWLFGFLY